MTEAPASGAGQHGPPGRLIFFPGLHRSRRGVFALGGRIPYRCGLSGGKNRRTTARLRGLLLQKPEIVAAIKLEAQVQQRGAITAFAPPHDALDSLTGIHSLHFHQLTDVDRETALE